MAVASKEGGLSQFVQEQCHALGLQFTPQEPEETLSDSEKQAIEKITFPADLNFTVPVNLKSSKKAFLTIVSGLGDDIPTLQEVWHLKPCDPKADYNPMGSVDLSYLTTHPQQK